MGKLDWFPKEFRAGDADGKINESLMGKPELSPLEILIRETAQNSWDARLPESTPEFTISLRTLDAQKLDLKNLLPINPEDTEFSQLLATDSLEVIEISDRGTTGLDGPVDMSPISDESVSKNFEDLIYKVGVPRHDGKGGGTYGFGKTATYSFSQIGTVIFWTRCFNETGELEDRFIVSAFRPQYSDGKKQYTGRHWWGNQQGEHIYPLQGKLAQQLGELLFESRFDEDETGTSLLILSPKMDPLEDIRVTDNDDTQDELTETAAEVSGESAANYRYQRFVHLARQAMREHLWPKLIANPHSGAYPMQISLKALGTPVEIVNPHDRFLQLWGSALNHVRNAEQYVDQPPMMNELLSSTQVKAITRYSETIGYLGITQWVKTEEDDNPDILNPSRAFRPRIGHIALMREQAELIVNTVDWFELPEEDLTNWVAVYRSVADYDALYAESEPPAHDSWNSKTERREVRLLVEHTKKKVADLLSDALVPKNQEHSGFSPNFTRTAKVASRFARLLPTPELSEHMSKRQGFSTGRSSNQPNIVTLSIDEQIYLESSSDFQRQKVVFSLMGSSSISTVKLSVAIVGEDSATEQLTVEQLNPVWKGTTQGSEGARAQYEVPATGSVEFVAPGRVALRVGLSVEEGGI